MNTKTTKFLAVLAVFAMTFAAVAVIAPSEQSDAEVVTVLPDPVEGVITLVQDTELTITDRADVNANVLDLNGKTLTVIGSKGWGLTYAQIASAEFFEVKNGKLIVNVTGSMEGEQTKAYGILSNGAGIKLTDLVAGSVVNVNATNNSNLKSVGIESTYGGIVITNSKITVTATDRAIYDGQNSGALPITIKGNSVVNAYGEQYGIRATAATLNIQDTAVVTSEIKEISSNYSVATAYAVGMADNAGDIIVAETAKLIVNANVKLKSSAVAPTYLTFDGGDLLGYKYTAGSSQATAIVAGKGLTAGSWSFNSSTLTLTGFQGTGFFKGSIQNVQFDGENILTSKVEDGDYTAGIYMNGNSTIKASTANSSLTVTMVNPKSGAAILVDSGTMTVGDITTDAPVTCVTVSGAIMGLYSKSPGTNAQSIKNATVFATGSEKAIGSTDGSPALNITNKSVVYATTLGSQTNGSGNDDYYGAKVRGNLTVSGDSVLYANGLDVKGTISTAAGKIFVAGGYVNKTGYPAGLYLEQATSNEGINLTRADEIGSAYGIYISDSAEYLTVAGGYKVTVTEKDGSKDYETTASDANGISTAINEATAAGAAVAKVIIPSGTANIDNLNVTVPVSQSLELIVKGTTAISGTVKVSGASATNSVTLTSFVGSASFSYGSITMHVIDWTGGDIALSAGNVLKLSGSIVTVAAGVTITGPTEGSASILVEDGKTLEITGTLYLKNKLVMNNDGSIIGDGTIDVPAGASFYSSNPVTVNFTGDGEIILDDATEKVYLSGTYTSTNVYSATQEVIVNGNLTVMSGAYIVITGGLKVLDGVTITIQDGGMILVTSVTAYAEIAGTIKSNGTMMYKGEECPGFYVDGTVDGDVEISGSVIAAKAPTDDKTTVKISGVVELTGTLTVNIKAVAEFDKLYVTDGGELIVNGTIKGQFYNESTVTINGKVADDTKIFMYADDATVNIVALTSGTLIITDLGAYLGKIGTEVIKVGSESNPANEIAFSEIAGVVVSENIYSYTYNNEKKFVNQTLLSGDATKATSTSVAIIGVTAGTATVAEELSLLKADMIVGSDAKLYVSGTIYADNAAAEEYVLTIYGAMTVTGLVRSTAPIEDEDGINAVMYTAVLLSTTFYNYTTLAAAIDAGATDLTVLGDLYVNTDTTIPAGMAVDASNSTVYIGAGLVDDTSVILTVANSGSLTAKKIDVRGSLAIENADTGIACSNIISDTYTTDDVSELYTNITTALKNAGMGDVVKITNKDGKVVLSKNATVALGATLVIPASKELAIAKKITLTVEGAIENKGTISGAFDEEADDDHAAIALSGIGTIQSSTEMKFDNFHIPGAYFEYKALYCITTVVGAQAWIALAEDSTIDIRGTDMAFGDVAFEGTADVQAVINVHSNMISGTITLSDAKIVIDAGKTLDVTITGAGGTIVFAGVASKDSTSTIETITDDDSETILTMTAGSFEKNSKSKLEDKAIKTTFDGIVMIDGKDKITLYKPSVKGVLGIASNVDIDGAANVSGVLAIDEDVKVDMKLTLTVSGTMTVGHGSEVTVKTGTDKVKPSITVTGSIIAAEKDEDGAKATVTTTGTLTTGSNDYAGADAVISGDVTAAFYKVYDDTTFDGKIAETLTDLKDAGKYTEFYVHDALWFTYLYSDSAKNLDPIVNVDAKGAITYNYQPKGLVDSVFSAWQKKVSGKLETITTATAVGGEKAVYALIDYNIYDVTIKTDAGIKSVSIDGIIMVNSLNNVFTLKDLAAGTHKVSYELKNGYSGTAVLSTSTGTILKDNSFALSGTEVTEFTFQLAGTEPTPEPEPVTPEEKSEWTVTTILLCVLVVLIAIMAVIVALRLNRN